MRAVVQRVTEGRVSVEEKVIGEISKGLVVLLGVGEGDGEADITYLVNKIKNLRIFEDENEKMNLSIQDIGGEILVISQFTLYGDCRKGNRPGFDKAARPQEANILYESFVAECQRTGLKVETGKFQANMMVEIFNDGPVTVMLDSNRLF